MLITTLILIVLFLAFSVGLLFQNFRRPYLQPAKPLPWRRQFQLQRQIRRQITGASRKHRGLFITAAGSFGLGLLLILISAYLVETKLPLLIFPTNAAISSVVLVIMGVSLLMVAPLIWSSQSYAYLTTHPSALATTKLASEHRLKRYRMNQIGSVLGLDLAILVLWIARAVSISTIPLLVMEYLLITAVIAIPVIALISLLAQLAYLAHDRYLHATAKNRWGVHYQADRALVDQQPALKRRVLLINGLRLLAYLLVIVSFVILYTNILAPAFTVNLAAVFPAAIWALVTLVILETIGALWPEKHYAYLQRLDLKKLPFKLGDRDQFNRYRYHLRHFHISAGVLWVISWLVIVGCYYYFS